MLCPNINHPDYKTMSKAVGPAKAHQLYAADGGQFIDKTPDGKPCELFKTLVSRYGMDEAIRLKGMALSSKKLTIDPNEITYTNEDGIPCAEMGMRGDKFTKGSQWEVVKDLKGYPSHANGGVDIKLGSDGFSFSRNGSEIKAAHGLVLPKINSL